MCVFPGPEGWLFNNNLMRVRFCADVEPWVIAIQHRFRGCIVESVEQQKIRYAICAHLAELDTLFASLQSRAFRGDL